MRFSGVVGSLKASDQSNPARSNLSLSESGPLAADEHLVVWSIPDKGACAENPAVGPKISFRIGEIGSPVGSK